MRRLSAFLLVLALAVPLGATGEPNEQAVTPLTGPAEQRIEMLAPAGEQHVEMIGESGVQQVTPGTTSPAGRAAHGVAKVFVGIFAAVVSLGVMAASLIFV
ncbi:MAG TPA: hypothetical protein VFD84_18165 [Candidatus Binatia bacterium]|nr:hypothetical protein [Candidatus Binatia bacterium]